MLLLLAVHMSLVALAIPKPAYEYYPPGFVGRVMVALLSPPTEIKAIDSESRLMRPLLLILAVPSFLLTAWWIVDGLSLLRRWAREHRHDKIIS